MKVLVTFEGDEWTQAAYYTGEYGELPYLVVRQQTDGPDAWKGYRTVIRDAMRHFRHEEHCRCR